MSACHWVCIEFPSAPPAWLWLPCHSSTRNSSHTPSSSPGKGRWMATTSTFSLMGWSTPLPCLMLLLCWAGGSWLTLPTRRPWQAGRLGWQWKGMGEREDRWMVSPWPTQWQNRVWVCSGATTPLPLTVHRCLQLIAKRSNIYYKTITAHSRQ